MLLLLSVAAVFVACTREVADTGSSVPDPDSDSDSDASPVDTSEPAVDEECNGKDDNGDGVADEGFDADGNGVADCMECELVLEAAVEHGEPEACEATVTAPDDPWDLVRLWEFDDADDRCRLTAVSDIDGDGFSEIFCSGPVSVFVLDGRDGSTKWTMEGLLRWGPIALGDADGDGSWDIAAFTEDGSAILMDATGKLTWQSPDVVPSSEDCSSMYTLAITDLGGDGVAEVLTHAWVLDGRNGLRIGSLPLTPQCESWGWAHLSFAQADADGDGLVDIFGDWKAIAIDFSYAWEIEPPDDWEVFVSPALLQLDTDAEAETAWASDNELRLVDDDGTSIDHLDLKESTPLGGGLTCAGDLDGDGLMEVVVAGRWTLWAIDQDGSILWKAPVADKTSYAGCTVFDFDGDGAHEVLYADEVAFYIFAGADGSVLFQEPRSSVTVADLPIVADVDGDGSVEILVPSPWGGGIVDDAGLRVYSHAEAAWPPGATFWPYEAWSGSGITADGAVEARPLQAWNAYSIFRGQPSVLVPGTDLRPAVLASCEPEVEDAPLLVALRMDNLGPRTVPSGTPLAVYAEDDAGTRTLLTVGYLEADLEAGWSSATIQVAIPRSEAASGVVVVTGDDGSGKVVDDCETSNDEVEWKQE